MSEFARVVYVPAAEPKPPHSKTLLTGVSSGFSSGADASMDASLHDKVGIYFTDYLMSSFKQPTVSVIQWIRRILWQRSLVMLWISFSRMSRSWFGLSEKPILLKAQLLAKRLDPMERDLRDSWPAGLKRSLVRNGWCCGSICCVRRGMMTWALLL